jgi:iron only hydrogenase large subunit-like protein
MLKTMTRPANSGGDLGRFLRDLKAGYPVRMLIAPAAPFVFKDFPRVLGYLNSLGVKSFYPVLPYADITVWAYYKILSENPGIKLISSACIGMNQYFKKSNCGYAGYLCHVFSPLLCTARYLKNYRCIKEPFAFLSPCRLKKKEFRTMNNEEFVRYNITIDVLKNRLDAEDIDISHYKPYRQESERNGAGLTLAAFGGIGKSLAALLPGLRCHVEQGFKNAVSYLSNSRDFHDKQREPVVFEPYACEGGCANGSGIGRCNARKHNNFLKCSETADIKNIYKLFSYYDSTLKLEDFCYRNNPLM